MKFLMFFFSLFGIILAACSSDQYVHISVSCDADDSETVEYLCKDNIPVYKKVITTNNKSKTKYEPITISRNIDDHMWIYCLKYVHSTSQDDSRFYEDPNYYKGTVRDIDFDIFYMNSKYYSLLDNLLMRGDICLSLTDSTISYRWLRNKIADDAMLAKFNLDHRTINNINITVHNRLINKFRVETDKDTSIISLLYSKDTLKSVVCKRFYTLNDTTITQSSRYVFNYDVISKDHI